MKRTGINKINLKKLYRTVFETTTHDNYKPQMERLTQEKYIETSGLKAY